MTNEVLFIEDDEEQRELTEQLLEMKADVQVDAYGTVEDVEHFDYPVAVTDHDGVDAEEVYDNIDQVIVYSGFNEDFLDLPEDAGYVQKGGSFDELAEEVRKTL